MTGTLRSVMQKLVLLRHSVTKITYAIASGEDDPMRYAIYFTPPHGDQLTVAAARWLGRDAFTGKAVERPDAPALSRE